MSQRSRWVRTGAGIGPGPSQRSSSTHQRAELSPLPVKGLSPCELGSLWLQPGLGPAHLLLLHPPPPCSSAPKGSKGSRDPTESPVASSANPYPTVTSAGHWKEGSCSGRSGEQGKSHAFPGSGREQARSLLVGVRDWGWRRACLGRALTPLQEAAGPGHQAGMSWCVYQPRNARDRLGPTARSGRDAWTRLPLGPWEEAALPRP